MFRSPRVESKAGPAVPLQRQAVQDMTLQDETMHDHDAHDSLPDLDKRDANVDTVGHDMGMGLGAAVPVGDHHLDEKDVPTEEHMAPVAGQTAGDTNHMADMDDHADEQLDSNVEHDAKTDGEAVVTTDKEVLISNGLEDSTGGNEVYRADKEETDMVDTKAPASEKQEAESMEGETVVSDKLESEKTVESDQVEEGHGETVQTSDKEIDVSQDSATVATSDKAGQEVATADSAQGEAEKVDASDKQESTESVDAATDNMEISAGLALDEMVKQKGETQDVSTHEGEKVLDAGTDPETVEGESGESNKQDLDNDQETAELDTEAADKQFELEVIKEQFDAGEKNMDDDEKDDTWTNV